MERPQLCTIAKIVGTQGNKGEVRALPMTDFPERFRGLQDAFLSLPGNPVRPVAVEGSRYKGNLVILKLRGWETISEAQALKGALLQVENATRVLLPPGHYFHEDLLNLKVETEDGRALGTLVEIWAGRANDVYVVRGERELLLPAIKEVVRQVDPMSKRMVVRLLAGMEEGS